MKILFVLYWNFPGFRENILYNYKKLKLEEFSILDVIPKSLYKYHYPFTTNPMQKKSYYSNLFSVLILIKRP